VTTEPLSPLSQALPPLSQTLSSPSQIEPDAPLDAPSAAPPAGAGEQFAASLGRALDVAGGTFERAARAEQAFESGRGGLQELSLERARADITLAVAATIASRAVQALSTILGMQV
jgi:flagellar hook-basal body complex protein FliE